MKLWPLNNLGHLSVNAWGHRRAHSRTNFGLFFYLFIYMFTIWITVYCQDLFFKNTRNNFLTNISNVILTNSPAAIFRCSSTIKVF